MLMVPPITSENESGYAAVSDHDIIESLPEGKTVYTDSRYAFGVVHDFGTFWRLRGF